MSKSNTPQRDEFLSFYPITTRWMDNDVFGHVNNVVYYSYFDTVINRFIAEQSGFDLKTSDLAAFIVHSQCFYHSSVSYPDDLEGAFIVNKVGNTSVEYGVAVFKKGEQLASAHGTMTHVFVTKNNGKPTPIPNQLRDVFEQASNPN